MVLFVTFNAFAQVSKPRTARAHIFGKGSPPINGTIADFQRDPARLVKEFSLVEKTRHLPFDFMLAVEEALGPHAWETLSAKQRIAMKKAFEKAVNGIWEIWNAEEPEQVRVLQSEVKEHRAVVTVIRGEELLRFKLASRAGAWFITEHEILDDALAEFSEAFAGVLHPETSRNRIYEAPLESATELVEKQLSSHTEKPEWWLMKYRLLEAWRIEESTLRPDNVPKPDQLRLFDEILDTLTTRWPDFAPGHLARARALLYTDETQDHVISPLSQDPEAAIVELKRYAELVPFDPRPHRDLAYAFEQMEKSDEAEAELRRAIQLDPAYLNHHRALVTFHLASGENEKAKASFASMLKAAPSTDEAFQELSLEYSEEKPVAEDGKALEALLLLFPKELERSYPGLALLTIAQSAQNKTAEAVKSLGRAMAIETSANDYVVLSSLYRELRRFTEALNAADQAIKLDDKLSSAWFERACSLAQLGRKRDALMALKQMLGNDAENYFYPEEPDLHPLAPLPEFKAIIEKMKEPAAPSVNEKRPKTKSTRR